MSQLSRLRVHGIRSFGDGKEEYGDIKFSSPLTLILGQNGSGKTTIIESLKYAVSGDTPPNSKCISGGNSFIHDPKISRKSETLAQIKLRFKDMCGKKTTVVRSMKNIQKIKKMEFKKLDQTITTETKFGDAESISSRCIDVDKQMCLLMGVSKPILNNVIFCHQEESNWPMEEGKKVKERFDEIFDAVRYNKALDKIRSMRKDLTESIRLLEKDVNLLERNKDIADQHMSSLNETEERLVKNKETIENCISEIKRVDVELESAKKKEINIAKLAGKVSGNEIKLKELQNAVEEIAASLPGGEFEGTDSDLEEMIKSFNLDFEKKKEKLDAIESQLKTAEMSEKHWQRSLNDEQGRLGGLKRDQDAGAEAYQQRNDCLNRLTAKLGLSQESSSAMHGSAPHSEGHFQSIMEEVGLRVRDAKRVVETLKDESEKNDRSMQEAVDGLRVEKAKTEQSAKTKKDQLSNTVDEMRRVKGVIDEVNHSTEKLGILNTQLERVKRDIEVETASVSLTDLESKLKEQQKTAERKEEELVEINRELDELVEASGIQTALDSCIDKKASCDAEIATLKSNNEDTLKHLLKEIPEDNVKQHLDLYLDELSHNIGTSQMLIAKKQKELTTLENNQHHLEEKLRSHNQTLMADEEEFNRVCGQNDYERTISEVSQKLNLLQDETGKIKASTFLFRSYIEKLQKPRTCCPLCERQFEADREAIQLAEKLEAKLKNSPVLLATHTDDLNRQQDKLNKLQQLKRVYERINLYKETEIPTIHNELERVKSEAENVREEMTNLEMELQVGAKSDESLARNIQEVAMRLDQRTAEARTLLRDIEALQAKMPATANSGRTVQQARVDRDRIQFELDNARKSMEFVRVQKNSHSERMNNLQTKQNNIVQEQLRLGSGVQQKKQLLDKQIELKELERTLNEEIEKIAGEMFPLKQKLESAIRKKEEAKRTAMYEIDEETKKVKLLESQCEEIQRQHDKVQQYERKGILSKLNETETNISRIKRDLEGLGEKKAALLAQKDTAKADINNQDSRHRDLHDNKKLRLKRKEEAVLAKTVADLKRDYGEFDYESLRDQLNRLSNQSVSLNNTKSHEEGMRKEMEKKVKELKSELQKKEYVKIDQKYVEKMVKLKVKEGLVTDLAEYYLATEWALKQFHKDRMAAVNIIIKDLWVAIYTGNDIDYIKIKTSEESETFTSADKRRVYHYRVVQVKDDVELDMRGRCSAGQKVLASIVIRMALAETFSGKCKIMTLDEPTTNMDRENIESLAKAIVRLVKNRDKCFQLVIITHDEDFLARVFTEEKTNHFWLVSRNAKGLSIIKKCEQFLK